MEYRRLGSTGLKVSPICLGGWRFGRETDEKSSIELIHHFLDQGFNFIDTANTYSRGVSETFVGKAVKGRRDQVVIATKVWGRMGDGPNDAGLSRRHILQQVEASLRRLNTDYIDLYQAHSVDVDTPLEETLSVLNDLVHQGKVRYIGCSNFPAWRLCKALWISDKRGWARFDTVQPSYSLLNRAPESELVPLCVDQGIGIINYSPLAGGLLTGKYRPGAPIPRGSRAANEEGMRRRLTDSNLAAVAQLSEYAQGLGMSVSQLALAWLLAKPAVTAPIIGARSIDQLDENLKAVDFQLDADVIAEIQEIAAGKSD